MKKLIKEYKPINKFEDLIIGEIYADVDPSYYTTGATYLKFVKATTKDIYFKYVSGAKTYNIKNGLIRFTKDNDMLPFYKL